MEEQPSPTLSRILIYPVKSLDGIAVNRATVLASGALKGDREFALVDAEGQFINGKRYAAIHSIRAKFDLEARSVRLASSTSESFQLFHLEDDRPSLEAWFSDYFDQPVRLIQETDIGFPDDLVSPGPTVISVESLETIATWFPHLTLAAIRRRFRCNLELTTGITFWEDQLFGRGEQTIPFQIGSVQMEGVNPCQRCIVPTRDGETGQADPNFQKQFVAKRRETLPAWVEQSRFNHFYRLAVNTRHRVGCGNPSIQIGDVVRVGE